VLSRRAFLRSSVGVAGAALLSACSGFTGDDGSGEDGNIVFSFGPDQSGSLIELIDRFNAGNAGFQVTYREMAASTTDYFDQLRTEFQGDGGNIDVIGGDVTWPAQFAAHGWIADLSDRFTSRMQSRFLKGAVDSNNFNGALWGVPWFTDAGMLYYRLDLLEMAGFSRPPRTWSEMKEMALKIVKDEDIKYGFVFQGAEYEGGVVNGLEYIWNAGGAVLDSEDERKVVIDTPEAADGLATERNMITEKVAPSAVTTFTETESQAAFLNGDAVFMRNWPYVFALAGDPSRSNIDPAVIGASKLPVGQAGVGSASALGGWSFFVNSESSKQDQAWRFIRFMTNQENQKGRALNGGFLPTLKSLYRDPEINESVVSVRVGGEALKSGRPRPVSPVYSDMSLEMAEQFSLSLKGDISPAEAVANLQSSLQEIVDAS
jgi:multiple sugar transport system substrate-binding protein